MRSQVRNRRVLSAVLLLISLVLAVSAQACTTLHGKPFSGPLEPLSCTLFNLSAPAFRASTGGELVITIPTHTTVDFFCPHPKHLQHRRRLRRRGGGYTLSTWPVARLDTSGGLYGAPITHDAIRTHVFTIRGGHEIESPSSYHRRDHPLRNPPPPDGTSKGA